MLGNPQARIEIIEVGCFTCPFTKAAEPLVQEVLDRYEGKVAFYFKYFPLPQHSYSIEASQAAECARDQNRFWEYKELLFTRQLECVGQPDEAHLRALYTQFATDAGIGTGQFNQCLDSGKYKDYVEGQKQENIGAGVYATPTFYINGKAIVAPKSVEEFSKVVDQELALLGQ